MFHQANLRSDVPQLTINGITKTYSLLTAWTEVIVAEMTRLTTWPLVTKKHDDIGAEFVARRTRDQCGYQLAWNYGPDGSTIAGATISSASACGSPVPVTFPGPVTSTNGGTSEQVSLFFLSRVSFESFSWFFGFGIVYLCTLEICFSSVFGFFFARISIPWKRIVHVLTRIFPTARI